MPKPDIQRLIDFHRLLLDFQAVERIAHIPGSLRQENDVEHSYNLALSAWFLSEYFPELDRDKVIRFALVHDLVEIHAGDTYIYADAATIATKKQREHDALQKLEKDWPDFPDMANTIKDYETKESPEAKFVYALDKIMLIMLIFIGKGYSWQKEHVLLGQLHANKEPKVALSPEIKPYYDQLYTLLVEHKHYFPDDKDIA